jgi:hypothetical protein
MKEYIAQRSKAFAGGLSAALATALVKNFETTFGIDLSFEVETMVVSGIVGAVAGVATYWAPANKPKA